MLYRVYDIRYDTDGAKVELPEELTLEVEDGADPSEVLADKVSDATGWTVEGFSFEVAATPVPGI